MMRGEFRFARRVTVRKTNRPGGFNLKWLARLFGNADDPRTPAQVHHQAADGGGAEGMASHVQGSSTQDNADPVVRQVRTLLRTVPGLQETIAVGE